MAIEPEYSYSWLPPSHPSSMDDLLTPKDLMPPKAIKSSGTHPLNVTTLESLTLQEDSFVLTPVTQPFQICVGEPKEDSFSHLQEPLHDPMLPFGGKHIEENHKSQTAYGLSSHFSPLSVHSLADSGVSSLSENPSERLIASSSPNYLDFDLDQIVEDVDDMFRERVEALEKQQEAEDSARTSELIKRNMPPEYFFTYTSKKPEELATDLAKSLVDKALESDRKKYIQQDPSVNVEDILENWIEVAGNRAMESILEDLLGTALNEISTSICHTFTGDFHSFKQGVKEGAPLEPSEVLQYELDNLVSDIFAESDDNILAAKKFGLYQISGPSRIYDYKVPSSKQKVEEKAFLNRWKGNKYHSCTDECNRNRRIFITAKMKREAERKRRNPAGILLSSLKKKVYHCRCIDCQREREDKGLPEPEESIEVKDLDVPDNVLPKEGIPIIKKQGRGRPRKYPRVEDFRRWYLEQEKKKKDSEVPASPSPLSTEAIKKKPRERPPKYQISLPPNNDSDNLKLTLSRKRSSRPLTNSKTNQIDCDSSDEGYSEFSKDAASNYQRTSPSKHLRLSPTSASADNAPPTPSLLRIEDACNKSKTPPLPMDVHPLQGPSMTSTMRMEGLSPIQCMLPHLPSPPSLYSNQRLILNPTFDREADKTQFIIIQEVRTPPSSAQTVPKRQLSEIGVQTTNPGFGVNSARATQYTSQRFPKKKSSGIMVSRYIQTDDSAPVVSIKSPPATKCITQSSSTYTDASSNTKQTGTSYEDQIQSTQDVLDYQKESTSNLLNEKINLMNNLSSNFNMSSTQSTYSKKCLQSHRTYSRKDNSRTSQCNIHLVIKNSESSTRMIPLDINLPQSFNKELLDVDTVPHDPWKVIGSNDAFDTEKDGAFSQGHRGKSTQPLKSQLHSPKAKPKVILRRLTEGVINSWCNVPVTGQGSKKHSFSTCSRLHTDSEVERTTLNHRSSGSLPSTFHELVVDAFLPNILDKDFLRASKALPVFVSH